MVSMKIVFDDAKLAMEGLSKAEILQPIDEHFNRCGATKTAEGEYCQDGSKSLCNFELLITDIIMKKPELIEAMDEWLLDVDGDVEDCIEEAYSWYEERRRVV